MHRILRADESLRVLSLTIAAKYALSPPAIGITSARITSGRASVREMRAGAELPKNCWNRQHPIRPPWDQPSPGGSAAEKGQVRVTARRGVEFSPLWPALAGEEVYSFWHRAELGTNDTMDSVLSTFQMSIPE